MHHRTAQIWTLKASLRSACGLSSEPFVAFLSFTNLAIDSFVPAIAGCRLQYVDSIDAYQQATMDKLQARNDPKSLVIIVADIGGNSGL